MRNLLTEDLFKAVRVIKASGLKEEVRPMLKMAAEGKSDIMSVGIEGIMTVIGALAESGVEKQLYQFLSGPFEMEPEEVARLDVVDLCKYIEWLWKEGNLQPFFGQLSNLIGTKPLI